MIRSAVSARSFSAQRLADADALRVQKRIGHAAADHEGVDLADQIAQEVELGRDLGAADHRDDRPGRRFERLAERLELGLHGAAGIGRQLVAETFGRGMGAMGGRKGVVDLDVAEPGELRRRRPDRSSPRPCGSGCFPGRGCRRPASPPTALAAASPMQSSAKATGLPEQLGERGSDRPQRVLGVASLRTAEMGEQDHLAALAGEFGDGRHHALEAGGVGDRPFSIGTLRSTRSKDALALHVDIIEGAERFRH